MTIERNDPSSSGDLSWTIIEKERVNIAIKNVNLEPGISLPIIAKIKIPNNTGEKFRLVIKEYERNVTDSDEYRRLDDAKDIVNEKLFKISKIGPHNLFTKVGRLVYFDMINLSF